MRRNQELFGLLLPTARTSSVVQWYSTLEKGPSPRKIFNNLNNCEATSKNNVHFPCHRSEPGSVQVLNRYLVVATTKNAVASAYKLLSPQTIDLFQRFCDTWRFMAGTIALVDPGLSHGGFTEELRTCRLPDSCFHPLYLYLTI